MIFGETAKLPRSLSAGGQDEQLCDVKSSMTTGAVEVLACGCLCPAEGQFITRRPMIKNAVML